LRRLRLLNMKQITVLTFSILLILTALAVNSAWTESTENPPGGSEAVPLNDSLESQSKIGGLILGTGEPSQALIIDNGNLCLGADCKDAWPGDSSLEIIAVHSQTTSTPSCPLGWDSVWTGYSFGGAYQERYIGGGQDLGSPGSCVEQFYPMPVVECNGEGSETGCNYFTSDDYAMWLSTSGDDTGSINGISNIEPYISRCNVCQKKAKVIVRHSQTSATPSCPSGSSLLWNGYSLKGLNLTVGMSSSQDLNSPGSCLQQFYQIPFMECQQHSLNQCEHTTYNDHAIWMTGTSANTGEITDPAVAEQYISRCAVCAY